MMNFFSINDAAQIWNNVKNSVVKGGALTRTKSNDGTAEITFITPNLVALGKITSRNCNEIIQTLHHQPILIWNISGSSIPIKLRNEIQNQVLDVVWSCPGNFSDAPTLACIFRICYCMKSWLDIRDDNIAIVHCANGRSRTGLIIACLMKFLDAFESSTIAFNYFCNLRIRQDRQSLAISPTYQTLFDNFDKIVDLGQFPDPNPLYLRGVAIAGLPVDEIPVLEIRDANGLLFSSHVGHVAQDHLCTWNCEYGDGLYRVLRNICGDFSLECRFGGNHAWRKEKSTVIFKYQNSTVFLPSEAIELRCCHVDVNPSYLDSLEMDTFLVHLLFEPAEEGLAIDSLRYKSPDSVSMHQEPVNKSAFADQSSLGSLRGIGAFEAGLDEISKYHVVEPSPSVFAKMLQKKFPEQYTSVTLQLANNNLEAAATLWHAISIKAHELHGESVVEAAVATASSSPPASQTANSAETTNGLTSSNSATPLMIKTQLQTPLTTNAKSSATSTTGGGEDVDESQSTVTAVPVPAVCVCGDDSFVKKDQLVPCTSCARSYHTFCFGARRIPFNLKTIQERENREKYIKKNYSAWRCPSCTSSSNRGMSEVSGQSGARDGLGIKPLPQMAPSTRYTGHTSSNGSNGHSNGLAPPLAYPASMHGESLPRPASFSTSLPSYRTNGHIASTQTGVYLESVNGSHSAHSNANGTHYLSTPAPTWTPFQPTGAVAYSQSSEPPTHLAQARPPEYMQSPGKRIPVGSPLTKHTKSPNLVFSPSAPTSYQEQAAFIIGLLATRNITIEQLLAMGEDQQKEVVLAAAQKRLEDHQTIERQRSTESVGIIQDAKYSKFFQMLKVGVPKATVAEAMVGEGITSDVKIATEILNTYHGPSHSAGDNKETAEDFFSKPLASLNGIKENTPAVANPGSPETAGIDEKYQKMLRMGVPRDAVLSKMRQDGVDPKQLEAMTTSGLHMKEEGKGNHVAADPKENSDESTITLRDHPVYSKYFKMLKVGLPKDAVKAKMKQENVDPSYLDRDPAEIVPLEDKPAQKPGVALAEHPVYSKYFKMLKVGLPKDAVKAKMKQENVDPSYLDRDPAEIVPLEDKPAQKPGVALAEHPVYSKYFKMLKVGLPKDAVKAKMKQENVDPSYLDRDPAEIVPLGDANGATEPSAPINSSVSSPKRKPVVRKKKLHWKAIDASKVSAESLWNDKDDDEDIQLDAEEFQQFAKKEKNEEKSAKPEKRQRINLIDMKRGQNAGIALARIKIPFDQLRNRVYNMEDDVFSSEQLKSLLEYLPTQEEVRVLKGFRGDVEMLGQAEKYMMEMMTLETAAARIQFMLFKRNFKTAVQEISETLQRISAAAQDVKNSSGLKKVLKTILKVGNRMNDGADHSGFTLDSLLKLQTAKAFDNKTSILQYVTLIVYRNDPTACNFPDELNSVSEVSRVQLETVLAEKNEIKNGIDKFMKISSQLTDSEGREEKTEDASQLALQKRIEGYTSGFLEQAQKELRKLDEDVEEMRQQFDSVLQYFSEDPNMSTQEFFSTLHKFIQSFVVSREAVIRQVKAELRKKEAEEKNQLVQRSRSMKLATPQEMASESTVESAGLCKDLGGRVASEPELLDMSNGLLGSLSIPSGEHSIRRGISSPSLRPKPS